MGVETTIVKYRRLNPESVEPTHGSDAAAGYDLYAAISEDVTIPAGETRKITTGLSMELPEATFGAIFARSGIATNQGLRPANCVGVVDSDYRGEIIVALHNDSTEDRVISPQMRIAQLVVIPYCPITFEVTGSLTETERGSGGFGSTGQ